MDLFQQYKILDAGRTFTCNFFSFRGRYFRDRNAGMNKLNYFPNWQPIPGALEEIAEKIEPSSMRVLKKDCMDLPPLIRQEILVDMTPAQKKIYKEMFDDYVAFFTDERGRGQTTTAELALTRGLRLMQIASGFVKTVEGDELPLESEWNPKQEALFELLGDLVPHHKVLIWCVWRKNYEQIRVVLEKLGVKHVELTGEQGPAKNMANAKEFEENPEIRCLIGHPGSGGVGLNLVSASYSIFYSRTFSLEHDLQAEARNYRGGSERHDKITRIDLVTRGTIEEEVTKKLASKIAIGDTLLKEITLNLRSK
jgi:SNF2 family DNA or RNA helicase